MLGFFGLVVVSVRGVWSCAQVWAISSVAQSSSVLSVVFVKFPWIGIAMWSFWARWFVFLVCCFCVVCG